MASVRSFKMSYGETRSFKYQKVSFEMNEVEVMLEDGEDYLTVAADVRLKITEFVTKTARKKMSDLQEDARGNV